MVPYARLTGADGMRLSRAAFGVMIKFSEFYDTFTSLVDEVDMQWSMLESDPERDLKMKDALKATPSFDSIFKRWESASKMRQWVNEKKKNLIDKIKKVVETEYKKKKEEEKNKQTEEKKEENAPSSTTAPAEENKKEEE